MNVRSMKWVMVLFVCASPSWAAQPASAPDGVRIATVGNLVFPSGVAGSRGSTLEQVDEVVQKTHEALARQGLGFGNMLQHTIYLRDGAAPPIEVLQRFHAIATRLAPSLKERRSVGTIVRVPEFPDKNTSFMLDVIAGAPAAKGAADEFKRIAFTFGPQEIVETIAVEPLVFTAGLEAMDFQHGTLVPSIDEQVEVIVTKLQKALQKAGLTTGNMISHNLYVKQGTDPLHVIRKFHEAARRHAPELKERPSVGTLVVVNGMAADGFLLEMDAVAARPRQRGKSDGYERVLFSEMPMDIAKSVAVGNLVFLSGMEGVDFSKNLSVSPDVFEQVEVAAKKIDATLRKSGLTIGNVVKQKLYVKKGAADPLQVQRKFNEAAARLAPRSKAHPTVAETLVVVEGLATQQLLFEASVIAAR